MYQSPMLFTKSINLPQLWFLTSKLHIIESSFKQKRKLIEERLKILKNHILIK